MRMREATYEEERLRREGSAEDFGAGSTAAGRSRAGGDKDVSGETG